jgi:hypothetical protein
MDELPEVREQDERLVRMSELATRAIENARRERQRLAASTPMVADEWVLAAATLEVSSRDEGKRSPPLISGTPAAALADAVPAAGDPDETQELPFSPLTPL